MGGAPAVLIIGVIVALAVMMIVCRNQRATGMVQQWAREEGVELLDYERRRLFRGPFFFRTSEHQEVYHVTVRDRAGRTRHAYVRCGGWFAGLWSDRVDAEWVD